ncbi:MAG: hypothetical protein M0Z54_05580 [Thermaerobacter sp.]|nr:hypothetical protein [Thermaerobacter sp.]
MGTSVLGDVGRVARFQGVRLLVSPRWAVGAVGALLIALYEGRAVAGLPAMNQWDVVWLGWNYLQLDVLRLFSGFIYVVGDIVLRDTVDAYGGLVLLRAWGRFALWTGTLSAIGLAAVLYVALVTAVLFLAAGLFVPFQAGWVVPPAHAQLLFGNGIGTEPNLNAHALWGYTPWRAVALIGGCATLTLWAVAAGIVAVTQASRVPYVPVVVGLVLAVAGLTVIYEVPPLMVPTTDMLVWYHAPYWLIAGGGVPHAFYWTLGWTWSVLGSLGALATLAGGWWFQRSDLSRVHSAG